jgi:alpha-amylase
MARITLLLAFHNHQPDGNFDHVFRQGYDDCYRPLLDTIAAFPRVKCALHHTGPLLEWLDRHRPAYLDDLRHLVERGQVELLGGGFYEPMLAVLPERDAQGQLRLMNEFCAERLGQMPRGMWLAERVWEPALAERIAAAGLDFTLIDDTHFRYAGMSEPLFGHYVTERAGTPLSIFPIEKEMRYAIPFKSVDDTIAALTNLAASAPGRDVTVTYGDDGEKFGMWPGTKEWVWGKGWLGAFFAKLSEPDRAVTTGHFADVVDRDPPAGRVYLPTASYEEMGEWALPAAAQIALHDGKASLAALDPALAEKLRPFVRGGIWQNFMARYPEANFMHKKMVFVSRKLAEAEASSGKTPALADARLRLYRGQCNCAYWHGLFGGLYLNYLRHAVYHNLIGAELAADAATFRLGDDTQVDLVDLDADRRAEAILANRWLWLAIKPDAGGGMFELDVRQKGFNLANVLGRHPEGYHDKLRAALAHAAAPHATDAAADGPKSIHDLAVVKDQTLGELLHYDRHDRLGFIDQFLAKTTTLDKLERGDHDERGDFTTGRYTIVERTSGREGQVSLTRRGFVTDDGGHARAVTVDKRVSLAGTTLTCRWRITLDAAPGPALGVLFAPELSLSLLAGNDPGRRYVHPGHTLADGTLASRGVLTGAGRLELEDDWSGIGVAVVPSGASAIWRYPLETASQSEAGFERTYQGSVLTPIWPIELAPGATFDASLSLEIKDRHA